MSVVDVGSRLGVKYPAPTLFARDPVVGCGGVISSSKSISSSVGTGIAIMFGMFGGFASVGTRIVAAAAATGVSFLLSALLNKAAASRNTVRNGFLTGVGVVSGVTVVVLRARLLRGATVCHPSSLLLLISSSLLLLLIYDAVVAAFAAVVVVVALARSVM